MPSSRVLLIISVLLLCLVLPTLQKGKTYDELEEMLKNQGENKFGERSTHTKQTPPDTKDHKKVVKVQ